MKKPIIALIVTTLASVGLLSYAYGSESSAKHIVGGKCTYREFAGKCAITEISGIPAATYFKYAGTINKKELKLNKNKINGDASGKKVGDIFDCKLEFITKGTCTPCLVSSDQFSFGECGKEAWDLYRSTN